MAQIVGYFQDDVIYTEGPFVLVEANGWRIETELEGHRYPVLPDPSIYELRYNLGWGPGKTHDFDLAVNVCDTLNQMTKDGRLIKKGRWWVTPEVDKLKNL